MIAGRQTSGKAYIDGERPGGSTPARAIPSLDGLRAISVAAVILSHWNGWSISPRPGILRSALLMLGQGGLGVSTFFIISGFLITTLLLEEREHTGKVDLKRFYFRRSLRIFPAFYVYLLVAAVVAAAASRPIPANALTTAATYTSDYFPYVFLHPAIRAWYVAHTWSLSVEEQFYLLWPFLLIRLSRRRAMQACIGMVLLVPLLRLATVLLLPVYAVADQWYRLFHTNADVLAMGCFLAFAVKQPEMLRRLERWFHPAVLAALVLWVAGSGFLLTHAPSWVSALLVLTPTNGCLTLLVLFFVLKPQTLAGKLLNWSPVRHVGRISYSLYLWQQLFLGPYNAPSRLRNLLALALCAELSFWVIETPFLRLRRRLERRLFPREPLEGLTLPGSGNLLSQIGPKAPHSE